MKIIFFDLETTGLIENDKLPSSDYEKFPNIVEMAFALVDHESQKIIGQFSSVVKPMGWVIPEKAASIHHITTEMANETGLDLKYCLEEAIKLHAQADFAIGWNGKFDGKICRAACCRVGIDPVIGKLPHFDPMQTSTAYFKLPYPSGRKGNKWPKLLEAYQALFGVPLESAHSAEHDVHGLIKVFFELEKRGVINQTHYDKAIADQDKFKTEREVAK